MAIRFTGKDRIATLHPKGDSITTGILITSIGFILVMFEFDLLEQWENGHDH